MTPALLVALTMSRVDGLLAREKSRDAAEIAALDQKAEALYKDIAPLGWRAAAPLGNAAEDRARAPKARLFAVTYLTKLGDPAVVAPLSRVLLDADQDPDVRSAAAQGLAALDAPAAPVRRALCAALVQPDLPRPVAEDVFVGAARLGCEDPAPLEKYARAFGPRPSGRDLEVVRRACVALGRSRGETSARRLLSLAGYFPAGGEARLAALQALDTRRADLASALEPEALSLLRGALVEETARPAAMLALVRVADALGPQADDLLAPLASHADAEVLATAAEALARRKAVKALPALESVVAGALNDPRFAPKPGRPDPGALLSRIETATETLRRARAARE